MTNSLFELTQLRSFVALAEELHFSRAAQRLNMTQPPLSRQIQQLEQILGVQLLERSSRFVRLTAPGKAFLVEARAILRSSEEAMVVARRVAHGEGGTITLGFIPAASYSLVPRLLAFAASVMPHVQFVLKEMVTADQAEALASARIDAGVLRMPIDVRGLEAVTVDRQRFVLAMPSGHWLAGIRSPTVKHLVGQPLIMYAPTESRYHYDIISSVFRLAGVTPNIVQYAREIHTMLSLVSAGFGFALVPEAAGSLGFAGLELRTVKLTPQVFSELTLVWRKRADNPALRVFTDDVMPRFLADDAERAWIDDGNRHRPRRRWRFDDTLRASLEAVTRGVTEMGALARPFPTVSLGEVFLNPTSMMYRNLMAMDTEEMIGAQPMDAVVLIGGCDKTVPAQLMGRPRPICRRSNW